MKNNYPIKYAIRPMYESVGWVLGLHELERNYDVVAYMISKCYLVNENKKYLADGTSKMEYEVVFPFEKHNVYNELLRVEPRFNIDMEIINSIIVDDVFDNYMDAEKIAQAKNDELLTKRLSFLSIDDEILKKIESEKTEHRRIIDKYKNLEAEIIKYTHDLKIGETPKEQSIIVSSEQDDKILNMPLYNYLYYCKNNLFCVCNVSEEEYDLMKKQIEKDESLDTKKMKDYNISRYVMVNDTLNQIIRIVDYNSYKESSGFYLKDSNLYYSYHSENMAPFKLPDLKDQKIIYTTETYEDIIESYIPNYVEELDAPQIKIGEAIISKRLFLK